MEADETFFLESKGKKQGMARKPRKRGVSSEQIPVLICRDRTGSTTDFVLPKADKKHITAALEPIVATDAVLCTDGSKAARAASRSMGIVHRSVNLSAGVRVVDKVYHVQNVNAYDSRLKTWEDATLQRGRYPLLAQLPRLAKAQRQDQGSHVPLHHPRSSSRHGQGQQLTLT